MKETRYRDCKDFKSEIQERFKSIAYIENISSTLPSAKSYELGFIKSLDDYDYFRKIESFISKFYEVDKLRSSIILCRQTFKLIVIVFKN